MSYFVDSLPESCNEVLSSIQDDVNKDILSSWPPERTGAFLVVYSLTDAKSFIRAEEILQQLPTSAPKYLVANQLDLQHRRQVHSFWL